MTEEEKEILKVLEYKGYKFIARSKNDNQVWAYKAKPIKSEVNEFWMSNLDHFGIGDKSLFPFIKWEDETPTDIHKLIVEAL